MLNRCFLKSFSCFFYILVVIMNYGFTLQQCGALEGTEPITILIRNFLVILYFGTSIASFCTFECLLFLTWSLLIYKSFNSCMHARLSVAPVPWSSNLWPHWFRDHTVNLIIVGVFWISFSKSIILKKMNPEICFLRFVLLFQSSMCYYGWLKKLKQRNRKCTTKFLLIATICTFNLRFAFPMTKFEFKIEKPILKSHYLFFVSCIEGW